MTRRDLLLATAATTGLRAASGYEARIAVQIYVWTQHLNKEKRSLADGVEDVIAGCRAAGFENAEFMSSFFAPELRDKTIGLLREHGLNVPVCYHGGPMHTAEDAERVTKETLELADALQPLGTRYINTNPIPKPKKALKTDRELAIQAEAVNRLGGELEKKGMQLLLHHHDPEMMENAREWRHLLRNTNLPLCIDLMWVARGGQDPLSILKEAGDRVATLHVRNMQNGVCTEAAGDGDIDYPKIVEYLEGRNWNGWAIVELFHEPGTKVTRSLEENLRLSREWIEETFQA
jgi:inosose dehydratase